MFETLSILRSGAGNIVWFFAWAIGIGLAPLTGLRWLDFTGLFAVMASISRAASVAIRGYNGEFGLQVALGRATTVATGLRWPGIRWDLPEVLLRLEWIGVALALVLFGALFFDRFDPARGRSPSRVKRRAYKQSIEAASAATQQNAKLVHRSGSHTLIRLTPLDENRSWGLYRMFVAELRLALKGYPWWWYAVASGLIVAQCGAPLEISRGLLLTAAWIWPIMLWSAMGVREVRHGTDQWIFSGPRVLPRQLTAGWLVGVVIAIVAGVGVFARLLVALNYSALLAWSAGALFVPTLALALGVWTKSSRPFEGLFTALWYIGPLNHIPGFDFTGWANGSQTYKYAMVYLALTAVLLAAALLGRRQQLHLS
jgi:hypothetical protein